MKKNYGSVLAFLVMLSILPLSSFAAVFQDVSDQHSAAAEISYLQDQGIIIEKPSETFRVNEPITRLEASAMIQRALKLRMDNRPSVKFVDVTTSHPQYQLIATMVDEGIFKGNATKEFQPNGHLKRGQMAAVLVRAFDLTGTSTYRFRDVPASYWALQEIQALAARSITTGYLDNTFKPNSALTRGHFAVFLARILEPTFRDIPICYKGDNEVQQVVNVPVTTLWKQPGVQREVDAWATGKSPNITKWVTAMNLQEKQWLVGKLETQALYGQQVKILQKDGEWVQIAVVDQRSPKHADGYPGWVPKSHLTAMYPNYKTCDTAMVTTKTANLTHDVNGKKVFRAVSFNTELPIVGEKQNRLAVQTPADGVKYLNKGAVKRVDSTKSIAQPTTQEVVNTARIFDGLPYLWAGASGFGFDCSGFTYSVYRQHGIDLPRDAAVQAVNGTAVLKNDLQPGDLLFFAYNQGKGIVHHVGMYIGKGQMIHAPNPKRTVEIIPITTQPYQAEYAGARRYVK